MPFEISSAALTAATDEAENTALRKETQEAKAYVIKTTEELVEILKKSEICVEASLRLNYGGLSTHFLNYADGILYDEGCDGEEFETTLEEFATRYWNRQWKIWINSDEIRTQLL